MGGPGPSVRFFFLSLDAHLHTATDFHCGGGGGNGCNLEQAPGLELDSLSSRCEQLGKVFDVFIQAIADEELIEIPQPDENNGQRRRVTRVAMVFTFHVRKSLASIEFEERMRPYFRLTSEEQEERTLLCRSALASELYRRHCLFVDQVAHLTGERVFYSLAL